MICELLIGVKDRRFQGLLGLGLDLDRVVFALEIDLVEIELLDHVVQAEDEIEYSSIAVNERTTFDLDALLVQDDSGQLFAQRRRADVVLGRYVRIHVAVEFAKLEIVETAKFVGDLGKDWRKVIARWRPCGVEANDPCHSLVPLDLVLQMSASKVLNILRALVDGLRQKDKVQEPEK